MSLGMDELKKKLYSRVHELPTLPVVVPKILQMMEDNKTDIKKITEVISYDPALTSKILKVANSSYYGFPRKIGELDRAVKLLGFNVVKSLALSLGVVNTVSQKPSKQFFSETGLWFHSVAVAILMREIGKTILQTKSKEYLFVAGLLHDLGKLVFDIFFSDLFEQAILDVENSGTYSLARSEMKIIGVDHGTAGALLLSRWNFPEVITRPIKYHHHTNIQEDIDMTDLAVMRIADALCQEFFFDSLDDIPDLRILPEDLRQLEMTQADIAYLEKYLHDQREHITSFFQSIYE